MFKSIKKKLLMAILAITFLNSLLVTIILYRKAAHIIENNYCKSTYIQLKETVDIFDNALKEIYSITAKAALDNKIIDKVFNFSGKEENIEGLKDIMEQYKSENSDISSIYILDLSTNTFITTENYPVLINLDDNKVKDKLLKIVNNGYEPQLLKNPIRDWENIIIFAQPINKNDKLIGVLISTIQERNLYYKYLDQLFSHSIDDALIMNENNIIISSQKYSSIGNIADIDMELFKSNSGIVNSKNDSEILFLDKGYFSKYSFMVRVKKNEILNDLNYLRKFSIIACLFCCIIVIIIANILTAKMCKPIKILTKTIEKIGEGNLKLRAKVITNDEIGILSKEFNKMLDSLEEIIQKLIEEEKLKKGAELEALQYQITPHFIYNTLNSIKFLAVMKGEQEIGELIGDFIELLQMCINKKGSFITVKDEIYILKKYINLQQFKRNIKVEIKFDIKDETEGCYVPRLLLQPLVENCFMHGMDMKISNNKIIICSYILNGKLVLTVKDNGRGMTKEQIERLMFSKTKRENGLTPIGIYNIKERIKLYYQDEAKLIIKSEGCGTVSKIVIPIKEQL